MANKYHITKKGEPGLCSAKYGCPLGGTDAEHFDTQDEARKSYEQKMTAQLLPMGNNATVGKKELNELAKITSDNILIDKAILEGSERTLKNLSKNANLSEEQLVEAYNNSTSDDTRNALVNHSKFPPNMMDAKDWAAVAYSKEFGSFDRRAEVLGADSVTDEHINELDRQFETNPRRFKSKTEYGNVLRNPNNKLSTEKIIELAERNYGNLGAAIASNRYPAERIPNLESNNISWTAIHETKNADYLDGYARWATSNQMKDQSKSNSTAEFVARNENTSPVTLLGLAENGLALSSVYSNPNADEHTKNVAKNISKEVQRMAKIEELDKKYPNGLKNELLVVQNTNQPYANRGLYDSSVMLNAKKVKELGLTKADIFTLMDAGRYNGGVSYNEETGVFTGTVDSTD